MVSASASFPTQASLRAFFSSRRDDALLNSLDIGRIPRHVAIIMDGNGRWALKRGLPRAAGHSAGVRPIREVISASRELGIDVLTLYSFSSENWRRPAEEVGALMTLFVEVLTRELKSLEAQGVAVRTIGDLSAVPAATREAFETATERTRNNTTLTLVVALNYGSRTEIANAARCIAADVQTGHLALADVDEDAVASRLSTAGMPDPDLVIRTSGELRISNFLLWQLAYSELWATATLWPDFRRHDFLKAVVDYQGRARRFGG